jgi:hypothetical protein
MKQIDSIQKVARSSTRNSFFKVNSIHYIMTAKLFLASVCLELQVPSVDNCVPRRVQLQRAGGAVLLDWGGGVPATGCGLRVLRERRPLH